jgi:hypothetical protein
MKISFYENGVINIYKSVAGAPKEVGTTMGADGVTGSSIVDSCLRSFYSSREAMHPAETLILVTIRMQIRKMKCTWKPPSTLSRPLIALSEAALKYAPATPRAAASLLDIIQFYINDNHASLSRPSQNYQMEMRNSWASRALRCSN